MGKKSFFLPLLSLLLLVSMGLSALSPATGSKSLSGGVLLVFAGGGHGQGGDGGNQGGDQGGNQGNGHHDGGDQGNQGNGGNQGNQGDQGGNQGNGNQGNGNSGGGQSGNNSGHTDGNNGGDNGNANGGGNGGSRDDTGNVCPPGQHGEPAGSSNCVPNGGGAGNCGQNQSGNTGKGNGNGGNDNGYGHKGDDCGGKNPPPPPPDDCSNDPSKCPPPPDPCKVDPSKCPPPPPPPGKCEIDPSSCLPPVNPPEPPSNPTHPQTVQWQLPACISHAILVDRYFFNRGKQDVLLYEQDAPDSLPQFVANMTSTLSGDFKNPTIAPDGCQFAVQVSDGNGSWHVRVYDFAMNLLQTIEWNGSAIEPDFLNQNTIIFVDEGTGRIVYYDLRSDQATISGAFGFNPEGMYGTDGYSAVAFTSFGGMLSVLDAQGNVTNLPNACVKPEWLSTDTILCHSGEDMTVVSYNPGANSVTSNTSVLLPYGAFQVSAIDPSDSGHMLITSNDQLAYDDGQRVTIMETNFVSSGSDWGR